MTLIRILMFSLGTISLITVPMLQDEAQAQGRRAPRRASAPRAGGVVVAAYYRPVSLSPFYNSFYDPWWFPYQRWYPQYGYGRAYDEVSSLRLQVSPRETEAFVDGYYAGTVDDFDGMFQRLRLEPGEHDVTLYLAGHRTVNQKIFLEHDGTFRIRHTMEPLASGETSEPRPAAPPRSARGPRGLRLRQGSGATRPVVAAGNTSPGQDEVVRGDPSFGAIAVRVQPADAEVLIDGERWEGPQDDEALVVQVSPGTHRIEVSKEGYRSYTAQVNVSAAQTSPINISLPRQ